VCSSRDYDVAAPATHLLVLKVSTMPPISGLFGSQPQFAKLNFGSHKLFGLCLVFTTLVVCHTSLIIWPTCHRVNFLANSCQSLTSRGCLVPSHILSSQSVASHKSVAAIKSVAKKLEVKLWQELVRKLTLWQVGHIINEVWQTTSVVKIKHKPNNLWLPKFSLANCGWEPNRPPIS
jgi:hypothetical protein